MASQHNGMTAFDKEEARAEIQLSILRWMKKWGDGYGEIADQLMGILDTIDQERQADYAPNQP